MNEPEQTTSSASSPDHPRKPNVVRMVLFAVLAVMVVALVYDYGYARPAYEAAATAIDDLLDAKMNATREKPVTSEDVRSTFRRESVSGLVDKGHYYEEHYQWRRGLPWQTLDIYVVYEHGDPPVLFNASRPGPPAANELPARQLAASNPQPTSASQAETPTDPPRRRRRGADAADASRDEAAKGGEPAEAARDVSPANDDSEGEAASEANPVDTGSPAAAAPPPE